MMGMEGGLGQTEHETKWKAKSRKPVSFMERKNEAPREEVEEVNGKPRPEVRVQVSTGLQPLYVQQFTS